VPAEAPGREGGLKSKKAITGEVMAFFVELELWSACGYITP